MSEEVLRAGMKVAVTKEGGNVQLPKGFCPSSYQGKEGCNKSFSITAVEWPGITHVCPAAVTLFNYINTDLYKVTLHLAVVSSV